MVPGWNIPICVKFLILSCRNTVSSAVVLSLRGQAGPGDINRNLCLPKRKTEVLYLFLCVYIYESILLLIIRHSNDYGDEIKFILRYCFVQHSFIPFIIYHDLPSESNILLKGQNTVVFFFLSRAPLPGSSSHVISTISSF